MGYNIVKLNEVIRMRLGITKDTEHLSYILSSAVWHYLQATEHTVNTSKDPSLVNEGLSEQKVIREKINPALKNPIETSEFVVEVYEDELNQFLQKILHHYLEETKEILRTIEDPTITQKCLEDVDVIENQIIKAIIKAS